jgi:hypothetical protein
VSQTYTAVVKQSGAWWIGWIEEIPGINCQERTKKDLLETLRVTLLEALELNRREAGEAAGVSAEETVIALRACDHGVRGLKRAARASRSIAAHCRTKQPERRSAPAAARDHIGRDRRGHSVLA